MPTRTLLRLLLFVALAGASSTRVHAEDALPADWAHQGDWHMAADPEQPDRKVVFVDALNAAGSEVTVDPDGREDYVLTFRVRYDHSYKGLGDGGGDGKHFPFWKVRLGSELWLSDSYAWSGLLLQHKEKDLQRVNGTRPKGRWLQYTIARKANRIQVLVDGRETMNLTVPANTVAPVTFWVMHEKLWLADLKFEPWHAIVQSVGDHAGDQWAPLSIDVQSGALPTGWNMDGGWKVVDDPERADHKVLYANAEKRVNSLTTADANFKNYDIELRVRFETPYNSFPANDNTHYPWWSVVLKQNPTANSSLSWSDQFIWNACFFQNNGSNLNGGLPKISRGKWQQLKITCFRNEYTLFVDGKEVVRQDIPDVAPGAVGLSLMDTSLWVDGLTIRPHVRPAQWSPEYRILPTRPGAVYAIGDKPALELRLISDDTAAHSVRVSGTVLRQALGHNMDTPATSNTPLTLDQTYALSAGETTTHSIELAVNEIGLYDASLKLEVDGRAFAEYRTTVAMLPRQPKWSKAYSPKLGLCVGSNPDSWYLANCIGVRWVRGEWAFGGLSRKGKGTWSYGSADAKVEKITSHYPQLGLVNMWMNGGRGHLLEGIDETAAIFGAASKHFGGRGLEYEVWNEPNHGGFWRLSPIDAEDFFPVQAAAFNAVRAGDPEAVVNSYSVSGIDHAFVRKGFAAGGWRYVDVLGYHPYGYPTIPEQIIPKAAASMKSVVDAFGGWVWHHITEQGYPTCSSSVGVDEFTQGDYHARVQLLMNAIDWGRGLHIYTLGDGGEPGPNPDPEARFGIVRANSTAKPAFMALATLSSQLANTLFVGQFDETGQLRPSLAVPKDEGAYIQVYRALDGSAAVLAVWAIKPMTVTVTEIEGEKCEAVSSYQSRQLLPIENKTLTLKLSPTPVYIRLSGDQRKLLSKAAECARREMRSLVCEQIEKLPDTKLRESLMARFVAVDSAAALALVNNSAPPLATIAEIAVDAIEKTKADFSATAAADALYHYEQAVARGTTLVEARDPSAAIEAAAVKVQGRTGDGGALVFTERILREARVQAGRAAASTEDGESAARPLFSALAGDLARIAGTCADVESVTYRGTVYDVMPKHLTLAPGAQGRMNLVVSNGEPAAFEATAEIEWPAEWKTPPLQKTMRIEPGARNVTPVTFDLPATAMRGAFSPVLRFVRDGKAIRTVKLELKIASPVEAAIEPLNRPLAETDTLTVAIRNHLGVPFAGTVELLDAAGSLLKATRSYELSMSPGAVQRIVFTIAKGSPVIPLNDYAYTVRVKSTGGAVVLDQPWELDIPVTVLTENPPALDGSVQGWTAAYPVHARVSQNGDPIDPANLSATAWSMIDSQKLYVMVRVRDDIHSQDFTNGQLWMGDSIQLSVDPRHTKTEGLYGPDDAELGFAVATDQKTQLATRYVSARPTILDQTKFRVRRDSGAGTTVYQVAVPLTELPGLTASDGYQFGWNIAVHDADKTARRERLLEVRAGTSMKNPGNYLTFTVKR